MTDCTNILLSFLQDVGEDFSDGFVFPTADAGPSSFDLDDFNIDDFLVDTEVPVPAASIISAPVISGESLSTDTKVSSIGVIQTPSRDEEEFQQTLGFLDFSSLNDMNAEDIFDTAAQDQMDAFFATLPIQEEIVRDRSVGKKRARPTATPACEMTTYKRSRASLNRTISNVCGMLKEYRVQQKKAQAKAQGDAHKEFRYSQPIATATRYLQKMFSNKPVTPQELLQMSTSTSTFECSALSSLVENSRSKKVHAKLAAWMSNQQAFQFPSNHSGVGQIAAASRAFNAGISDILSSSVVSSLKECHISLPSSSAIVSRNGQKISAPFTWSTDGMIALGYPKEIEFHGLIRATFASEGVSSCNVTFDACKILREQQDISVASSPKTVAVTAMNF